MPKADDEHAEDDEIHAEGGAAANHRHAEAFAGAGEQEFGTHSGQPGEDEAEVQAGDDLR